MRTAIFAAATILTLSTAMAEPAQVRQQMQIASTHADIRSSSQIRDRFPSAATDDQDPSLATGTDAIPTQPVDSDPEPESINGGTEP